jgi:alginate O-acetyltransferase complex protein AlgI
MAFTSPSFIAFVIVVALLTSAIESTATTTAAPALRGLVLALANAVFIASFVDNVQQLAPFAAFLLLCFLAVEAVRRSGSRTSLWVGVIGVVASFVVLKKFSFLGDLVLPFPYLVIGLSYVLFRVLHLMVDAKQGELGRAVGPLAFFNYTCSFLSFIAGPIQRYPEFAAQARRPLALNDERVFGAFARVIEGFVKVGVVSAVFKYLFDKLAGRLLDTGLVPPALVGVYLGAAACYTVYLYANFAGYMDIVIGVGRLLGFDLPENFNQPFRARSFLDFWSRWHMTLSDWFKTYVFNPLLTVLATRFTSAAAAPYLGVVAFFVTFLIMGLWHGTTAVFVVYGALMGAGASVNKLWQVWITRRVGKKRYKAWGERAPVAYLCRGLTCAYFALALTCLWLDLAQLGALLGRLGIVATLLAFVALAVAAGVAFFAWDTVAAWLAPLRGRLAGAASGGVMVRNLALAAQVLLVVTVASFFHKAPEFVYRAF